MPEAKDSSIPPTSGGEGVFLQLQNRSSQHDETAHSEGKVTTATSVGTTFKLEASSSRSGPLKYDYSTSASIIGSVAVTAAKAVVPKSERATTSRNTNIVPTTRQSCLPSTPSGTSRPPAKKLKQMARSKSPNNNVKACDVRPDEVFGSTVTNTPASNDIVFRCDPTEDLDQSNIQFRVYVQRMLPDFIHGTTGEKGKAVSLITEKIRQSGARFWMVASQTADKKYREGTPIEVQSCLFEALEQAGKRLTARSNNAISSGSSIKTEDPSPPFKNSPEHQLDGTKVQSPKTKHTESILASSTSILHPRQPSTVEIITKVAYTTPLQSETNNQPHPVPPFNAPKSDWNVESTEANPQHAATTGSVRAQSKPEEEQLQPSKVPESYNGDVSEKKGSTVLNELSTIHPRHDDVIFGRGEPTRKHPGNIELRKCVNGLLDEYMSSSKGKKSNIIRRVMDQLEKVGARYLVPLDASCRQAIFGRGCREATLAEVRSKISHAFRDGERRILVERKQRQQEEEMKSQAAFEKKEEESMAHKLLNMFPGATSEPTQPQKSFQNFVHLTFTPAQKQVADHDEQISTIPSFCGSSTKGQEGHPSGNQPYIVVETFRKPEDETSKALAPDTWTRASKPNNLVATPLSFLSSMSTRPNLPAIVSESYDRDEDMASILFSLKNSPANVVPAAPDPSGPSGSSDLESEVQSKIKRGRKPKKKEESKAVSAVVQNLERYCRPNDVVFGRGAPLRQHPGNIKFRSVVGKYNERYRNASKHEKTEIILNVITELQICGAKFLVMDEDMGCGVTEASPDDIRMKVSHRFRDFTKGKTSKKRSSDDDSLVIPLDESSPAKKRARTTKRPSLTDLTVPKPRFSDASPDEATSNIHRGQSVQV